MASILLSSSLRSFRSRSFNFFSIVRCGKQNFCSASGPWMMLSPGLGDTAYNFYSLSSKKIMSFNNKESGRISSEQTIVGSSYGWLALFNWRTSDLFLLNPISGREVKLPSIRRSLPISEDRFERGYGCVDKVIISCDDPESEECRVIMIFLDHAFAICCPSISNEWSVIDSPRSRGQEKSIYRSCYEDVVFSKKLLFSLASMDTKFLEGWDVGNHRSPKLHWELVGQENYRSWDDHVSKLLGESTGFVSTEIRYMVAAPDDQLLLVTRFMAKFPLSNCYPSSDSDSDSYPQHSIAFHVHKIDREGGKLSYVEGKDLDGLAIFVGLNHCFAVPASDHKLNPNSIYFTDFMPSLPHFKYGGHDIGIFDCQTRTVSPCYYPCDVQTFKKIIPAPIWFTPTFE